MSYTDAVGQPIAVDNYVVYSVKSGSSGVQMVLARITDIVEIVPTDPNDEACRTGQTDDDFKKGKYRPICGIWVKRPNLRGGYGDWLRDDSKAYVLKVQRLRKGAGLYVLGSDKIVTVHNVANVVVVTPAEGMVE